MAQRPQLSLTAELERIEQKITLTLQEIDHNFARAHRIVTTSILPIVERYGKESDAVWQGSEFWKHFFEASANVALTNYQEEDEIPEGQRGDEAMECTQHGHAYLDEATSMAPSSPGHYTAGERTDDFTRDTHQLADHSSDEDDLLDDSLLESLHLSSSSTPKQQRTEWADMESQYETLAKELTSGGGGGGGGGLGSSSNSSPVTQGPPTTPRNFRGRRQYKSPESSPFRPPPTARTPGVAEDQLMHRVLDKNWRLAATPLSKPAPSRYRPTTTTPRRKPLFSRTTADDFDSSPISSPPEPQLQTQIFTPRALRTPGAARFEAALAVASVKKSGGGPRTVRRYMFDSDDDSDDDFLLPPGFSPPKTMQFSLPPSKLLATPAREASRRIVHDILKTAGAASADGTMTTEADSSPAGRGRGTYDDDPF